MGGKDHEINVEEEGQYASLLSSITKNELEKVRLIRPNACIYIVPDRLRRVNEAAYTPKVVSIGPIHREKSLKIMKDYKRLFLKNFLLRTGKDLIHYIKIVKDREESLRECYQETFELNSDEFCHIILVDAVFIVELFLCQYPEEAEVHLPPSERGRLSYPRQAVGEIWPELLLLENQLPFFLLQEIWKNAAEMSITRFFQWYYCSLLNLEEGINLDKLPLHFVDLVRNLCIPQNPNSEVDHAGILEARNATELNQAGIEFTVGSSKNLFDISFSNGELKIPKLKITDSTESRMRNLAAFEQCHYAHENSYICHYLRMLYYLVNTHEDVDLLVKNQILENWIGDSKTVSAMINKLCVGIHIGIGKFYFGDVFKKLDKHYRTPWIQWKVDLKQNYFKTPSAFIPFSAATALLVLTIIQTIAAVIPLFKKNNC